MTTTRTVNTFLSKSRFMLGLQCPKALWLNNYRPELKDEVSDSQDAVFQSGTDVGVLARDIFPGGVEIPFDGMTTTEQLARTRQLLDDGVTTLYEAAFSHDGVFVKVDLLHKGREGWELHEVKGSTGMKRVYLDDIAVQYHVVTGTGMPLSYAGLVHVNNQYVRLGGIDVQQLFTRQDLTENVAGRQDAVQDNVATLRSMLAEEMPNVGIGPHCSNPYGCPFQGHCWSHVPSPSVFDLRSYGKPDPFSFYEEGLVRYTELPLNRLGWRQRQQVEAHLNQSQTVDNAAVGKFLGTLTYPLSFLDFETTYMTPMPLFNGTRPYQQVPFQYSLHIIRKEGGEVEHHAWLAAADEDNPAAGLLTSLLAALPESGAIITWNKVFESRILGEMGERFRKLAPHVTAVRERLVDLMVPFRNRDVYDWQMHGSASLKSVLPALIPELSYDGLEIADGGAAASAWLRMRETVDLVEREAINRNLLEYCHLDTLAMVRILEWLRERVG